MSGRTAAALLGLALLLPIAPAAAGEAATELPPEEGYGLLRRMLSESAGERRQAARRLAEAGDASLVPGLVDALFFSPRNRRAEVVSTLAALTGARRSERYHDWVDLVARREDLAAKDGYLGFKAELFSRIDPRYPRILYAGAPSRIRLEEVVSGGVGVEGIPALDNPAHLPAEQARYLKEDEKVFGVDVGGERRAYPLRILDWHEMLNDVVGGEPVTLSYCTLCGSGVLYATRTPAGSAYTFGTSGLLYRSNKLMVDRQTLSLWNNLTGEPVVGRLARSPIRLEVLPLVITTWKEWRERHPDTTALALPDGRFGFDYRPGAANRARAGVSFPVPIANDALDAKDEVFAVRLGDRAKAYPVEAVLKERVVNDRLGEVDLVVVGDPESGAIRAYRREGRRFAPASAAGELVDEAGGRWRVEEQALVPAPPEDDPEGTPEGDPSPLERVPGHHAFWFGWHAFFPHSELYGAAP
jgi:hypothetical protein